MRTHQLNLTRKEEFNGFEKEKKNTVENNEFKHRSTRIKFYLQIN